MKPALYYAIRKNLYNTIAAITSEKTRFNIPAKWYGRDVTHGNEPTHGNISSLMGRFKTLEDAEACRDKIKAIGETYNQLRNIHNDEIRKLYRLEGDEIREIVNGYYKCQS
jgi:hypothetical protein